MRAATLLLLPFVDHVWQLLIASLVLEMCTLLWSPAKEASVPNLVPRDRLTTANSLSLAAAYGTFPFASLVFALLAKVAQQLGQIDALDWLQINQESVAFWFDTLTFLISAAIIWRLALPRLSRNERQAEHIGARASWTQAFSELKEGWRFIVGTPVVRAVNLGLAVGLIGGGMLVPARTRVLRRGPRAREPGLRLLTTALGFGVAVGVLAVSVLQKRVPKEQVFAGALVVAGVSLATRRVGVLAERRPARGGGARRLHRDGVRPRVHAVAPERQRRAARRIFSALYTLVRLCVLIAFAVGPLLSGLLGNLSESLLDDSRFEIGSVSVFVPGVRLTLWLAAAIILGASALAIRSLRSVTPSPCHRRSAAACRRRAALAPTCERGRRARRSGPDGAGSSRSRAARAPASRPRPGSSPRGSAPVDPRARRDRAG